MNNYLLIIDVVSFNINLDIFIIKKDKIKYIIIDRIISHINFEIHNINMLKKINVIKNNTILSKLPNEILDIIIFKSNLVNIYYYSNLLKKNIEHTLNNFKIFNSPIKILSVLNLDDNIYKSEKKIIDSNYIIKDNKLLYYGKLIDDPICNIRNEDDSLESYDNKKIKNSDITISLDEIYFINYDSIYYEELYLYPSTNKMDYIVKNTYYIDSYTMIKGKYYKFSYLEYTSVIGSEFIDEGFYIKEIMNFYLFENGITNTNSFNKYILVNKKYLKKVLLVDDKFIKNYKINDNLFEIDDLKNKVISYGTDESFSNDVTFNGVINSIEKNKDYYLNISEINNNCVMNSNNKYNLNDFVFIDFDYYLDTFKIQNLDNVIIKNKYQEYEYLTTRLQDELGKKFEEYKGNFIYNIENYWHHKYNYLLFSIYNNYFVINFIVSYNLNGEIDYSTIKKRFANWDYDFDNDSYDIN